MNRFSSIISIGSIFVVGVSPLYADTATEGDSAERQHELHSRSRMVEEVIVTAQKREEKAQDVPISIQAFGNEKLEAMGVETVQDLQRVAPGFTLTTQAGFNIAFLRGVGSDAFLPGIDSAVPFYLDGVPLVAAQSTSDTLGRVERVEVLKGPQGTLFGRNATGGAISIVTPDPGEEFVFEVTGELGNYNQKNYVVFFDAPVLDSVGITGSWYKKERDNYLHTWGEGVPDIISKGGRLKVRWDILDSLSVTLGGNYTRNIGNGAVDWQLTRPSPTLSANGLILPADSAPDRTLERDGPLNTDIETELLTGVIDWTTDWFDTKLILSTQAFDVKEITTDFDGTTQPILGANGGGAHGSKQYLDQDTAEIQILSNESSPFSSHMEWVIGAFYLESNGGLDPFTAPVGPGLLEYYLQVPGAGGLITVVDQALDLLGQTPTSEGFVIGSYGVIDTESLSYFAQTTYYVTQSIDATLGVRWQKERRDLIGSRTSLLDENYNETEIPFEQADLPTIKATLYSPRASLQWRPFGGDNQIYISYARGYKSPTYNAVNFVGNTFDTMKALKEERVDTAEFGFKTEFFDKYVRLNGALFSTVQKDPLSGQVSILSGGVTSFTNAGEAEIKGAEIDFQVAPIPKWDPGLIISGAASYIEAEYTEFENGQGYDDDTGLGFGEGGGRDAPRDFSGNKIPRVPEQTYQLTISQRFDFGSFRHALEITGDMFYTSKMYLTPQNSELVVRDSIYLFNARASYFYNPWNIELTAFINNINDEVYIDSVFFTDFGIAPVVNSNPRLSGLRLKYTFE